MTPYRQPDGTTCGAAVLVMARMLAEPGYGRWVRDARDRGARFADEVLRTHRRTNRLHGRSLPWPRALGTQPWALAAELPRGGRVWWVGDRARGWTRLEKATSPVPLYIGNRLLPRHVVLVTASDHAALTIYDPDNGDAVTVPRDDFVNGRLGVAGWDEPWFVVTPR